MDGDDQQQQPGDGAQPDDDGYAEGEDSHRATVASLDERLDRLEALVRNALRGGGGGAPARGSRQADEDARRQEMSQALADLRKQEKADRQMTAMAATVRKLERAAEQVPREIRRVEQFMGWHGRD